MTPNPDQTPAADQVRDPQHDPTAAYALDQTFARRLTALIRASGTEAKLSSSPLNHAPLAAIPQSTVQDVADAFEVARQAQVEWVRVPLAERQRMMLRFHELLMERRDEIADLIVLESGKAKKHAFDEVMHVAMTARYYGLKSAQHLATEPRTGVMPGLTKVEVNHVPKGVVGIISPWNYPFTMAMSDGLPALMAGNAVIAKPDAQTMLTGLIGVQLLREAGFPAEVWQVVAGPGRVIGTEIISRADYLCFTGSTATGKTLAKQCAERLISSSLELGGKNPMLVLADANIDKAADGATRAAFSNAGQLCVSIERLFVHESVYDEFLAKFAEKTKAMRLGDPALWTTDMGSLISADQLETVQAHVEDARAKGVTVMAGGKARPDLGPYFYEPTVLADVVPEMACFGDETFGPVVSVYKVRDDEEAVRRANEGPYGLNCSIYSKDTARARELAKQIKCGTVNINEGFAATFASIDSPMGGMRESGTGRRQGPEGILRYTDIQTVAVQRLIGLKPLPGLSDQSWAKMLVINEKLMRKIGRAG